MIPSLTTSYGSNLMKKRATQMLIPILILAILMMTGLWYWHHEKLFPSTNDAYVQADTVDIAPQVTGRVLAVNVNENQAIKKGQTLFLIDPKPFALAVNKASAQLERIKQQLQASQMAVNSANAKLNQAQAELVNAKAETARILIMVKKGFASKSAGDNATKNLSVAKATVMSAQNQLEQAEHERGKKGKNNAQLKEAQTALAQAKLNLSYTNVRAPESGFIENTSLHKGSSVNAYQPVFALVENNVWWVDANFKETDIERIQKGQPVLINLDMYSHHTFHGKVLSLSASSSSSFSLLPPQNASANWVKVTQRFPVRILMTDGNSRTFPLRIGASATVSVDTRS
jgi:membrane fusion protein, multidrug efflux system